MECQLVAERSRHRFNEFKNNNNNNYKSEHIVHRVVAALVTAVAKVDVVVTATDAEHHRRVYL